ncbi:MAG TPA: LysR family transcriptional regulator [Pirellulales bacterium]|jgi:DNA-binding transcriptional LysR family regulator|nr:LysR family transcriptional regulator [Pirellulales bacterium]
MVRDQRYKELQLTQLRSFCLAATEGNFTSAARTLGLSASTVWQQVRALERRLGARLLRRHGRAVELTDDGRALLEIVQPHVAGLDSLDKLFESRRGDLPQELTIASGAYLFAHHLTQPIQQFRALRPAIRLHLRVAAWAALNRLLERGEVDVAVMACDPHLPRSPDLEYEHLFDEQLTLLAPAGHPLTKGKRVKPQDLVKHPLILPPKGGADRTAIDRYFRSHNLADQVQVPLVCGLVDVVAVYVTLGLGVALMYVTDELTQTAPRLQLRVLDAEIGRLPIELAVRKGAHLPDHVQEFRRIIVQSLSPQDEPPAKRTARG